MRGLSYSDCLCVHNNTPNRQIVGRQFQPNLLANRKASEAHPGFASHKRQKTMAVCQLHTIRPIRQHFNYGAFNLEGTFSVHVRISGSASVIKTVCSK
jgi:hypothetical protein